MHTNHTATTRPLAELSEEALRARLARHQQQRGNAVARLLGAVAELGAADREMAAAAAELAARATRSTVATTQAAVGR